MAESESKQSKKKTPAKTASKNHTPVDEPSSDNQLPPPQAATHESNQTSNIGNPTVQTVEKKSGSGLSVFAVLLSLIAIGVTGYTWYRIDVLDAQSNTDLAVGMQGIAGQVTRIGDSVSILQSSQSNAVTQEQLTTRLLEAQVSVDKQLGELDRDQKDLSESVLKISSDFQKGSNEYVIDEVSHLLKLANNNVIFSNDIDAAINAFNLADTQLKELASPRFSEVRRKINNEIELLRAVEQIDIESTLAKLSAISAIIDSLPLENEPPVLETQIEQTDDNIDQSISWRTELRKMWSDVLNSVTIQRVDQPPKPLLAPQERYFLNQNVQLTLNKAEIALLQGRQQLYVSSVAQASDWLNEYFDLDHAQVKNTIEKLDELQSVNFAQDIPSVAGSYDLLQSIKGQGGQ